MKAHHKVGVLRVKEGQRNEEDIFCNCHESGPFDEFLNVLGKLNRVSRVSSTKRKVALDRVY